MFNLRSSKEKDKVPGGLSDNKSDKEFDPKQIEKGIRVELEHTDDKKLAREIAQDHLSENPRYYDYLDEMEKKMDKKSFNLRSIKMAQYQPQHPSVGDRFQQDINKQNSRMSVKDKSRVSRSLAPIGTYFNNIVEFISQVDSVLQPFGITIEWDMDMAPTVPEETKRKNFEVKKDGITVENAGFSYSAYMMPMTSDNSPKKYEITFYLA